MEKSYSILSVDTSLDETSAAVTVGRRVLSNVVSSQIELHKKYGGIVPIITKRAHTERIMPVIQESLRRATARGKEFTFTSIDAFAVTIGPGQALALEVGVKTVQNLAQTHKKPLIAVNHMEGHLLSSFAQNSRGKSQKVVNTKAFPLLGLLISGGHTQLVLMRDFGNYELLGETLDDAIGEAFDKVGRMLGLGYPGGQIIERLAKEGDEVAFDLPVPMRKRIDKNLHFSYSGIKTALMYLIKDLEKEKPLDKTTIQNLAASFQRVVTLSLVDKLELAITQTNPKGVLLGGGVVSNVYIRNHIRKAVKKHNIPVNIPYAKKLFTDNAGMIGVAAYYKAQRGEFVAEPSTLDRSPNLSF